MHQLTQLAAGLDRQRTAHASQQHPAGRLPALRRATRRTARKAWRLRAQHEAPTTHIA